MSIVTCILVAVVAGIIVFIKTLNAGKKTNQPHNSFNEDEIMMDFKTDNNDGNNSLDNIEVDYEKQEVKAQGRIMGFDMISHYEFEHVETVWKDDYDKEDSDMRASINRDEETMRVCGVCDELPELEPRGYRLEGQALQEYREREERHWALCDEVRLKLYFRYWQGGELKTSFLGFSQKDAIDARRKLKPLIKHLRECP